MADYDGSILFPDQSNTVGKENEGIENCKSKGLNWKELPLYCLDTFAEKILRSSTIYLISIDVESFDYDVILGRKSYTETHRVPRIWIRLERKFRKSMHCPPLLNVIGLEHFQIKHGASQIVLFLILIWNFC